MWWTLHTPLGIVSINNEWGIPANAKGKFQPCWNGCGVAEVQPTFEKAKAIVIAYLKPMKERALKNCLKELVALQAFDPRALMFQGEPKQKRRPHA
jgi:hypothetical protein